MNRIFAAGLAALILPAGVLPAGAQTPFEAHAADPSVGVFFRLGLESRTPQYGLSLSGGLAGDPLHTPPLPVMPSSVRPSSPAPATELRFDGLTPSGLWMTGDSDRLVLRLSAREGDGEEEQNEEGVDATTVLLGLGVLVGVVAIAALINEAADDCDDAGGQTLPGGCYVVPTIGAD